VAGVNIEVLRGEIFGLIGPNGAGKTSLFNCLSGLYRPTGGSIHFDGQEIARKRPWRIRTAGIARTFQNIALVDELTVFENILVGGHVAGPAGFAASVLRWSGRREAALHAEAHALCERLGLSAVMDALPADLPYGTQKRIELARALMAQPRMLLADEPAAGLSHGEVAEFGRLLQDLRAERGLTIVLVEHHMGLINAICDRIAAMESGRIIAVGSIADVAADPAVRAAYLGGPEKAS
jgi:branched-chain amino acid transport system ATP-binding protein